MSKSPSKSPASEPLAQDWSPDIPEADAAKPYEIELYFDDRAGHYYRQDDRGTYIKTNAVSARRFLKVKGFSAKRKDGELSEAEKVLEFVETCQNCDYAAPLAGHTAGLHQIHGRRILVTVSPRLVTPSPGSWGTIQAVLEGLLGEEQCRYFYAWLKVAIESVRHSRHRRGQALIVAGPANCGKSLCQAIITELLGGRIAKPFAFLCGRTEFNSEQFAAEHLVIEDEPASSDPRVRKRFGSEIKSLVANLDHRCHAKSREALELRPIWRLSITLNDDPASLLVLPQWEEGLKDKLMLFHARAFVMPIDTSTDDGEALLWRTIISELPAFASFLESYKIPQNMRDSRFVVKAYHNEALLDLMDAMTDEMKLLEIIDGSLFDGPQPGPWEGLARDLEIKLNDAPGFRHLLTATNSCGSLLGGLANKGKRVERLPKRNGNNRWRITPPQEE